jgi:hypothetical protein
MNVNLTEDQIYTALRSVLLTITNNSMEIVIAQDNRVPEPMSPRFIVMQRPVSRLRLSTNARNYIDNAFVASIAGTVMTVTSVLIGSVSTGAVVLGSGVAANTIVGTQLTGVAGGIGTYAVTPTQTLVSTKLATGTIGLAQPTKLRIQLDVHGPDSADVVQTISSVLRDDIGYQLFVATGYNVFPLYCDPPIQDAFDNAEQQTEVRQLMDIYLQANTVVTLPQYFIDQLHANSVIVL